MPIPFFKMSGSGNDFLVFDARNSQLDVLTEPRVIEGICARRTGVGADGIVLVSGSSEADLRMVYYNRDGSRAEMCGNAALCVISLASRLTGGADREIRLETDTGILIGSARGGGAEVALRPLSKIDSDVVIALDAGERRIGFADAGVPHLVVLVENLEQVPVLSRGSTLRRHRSLARGANVNFVSGSAVTGWAMRTYERGVEAETLACGTGAIAVAALLRAWGESGAESAIRTRSGAVLAVRLRDHGALTIPTLSGEGRLVFTGQLEAIENPPSPLATA